MFPSNWIKWNIIPIHKTGDKQILKNYRPVSLLLICGKILERLIFNEMFNFLFKITLFRQISLDSNLGILVFINYRRASRGGVQGVQTPALFPYSPNYALKFLNQFRGNALKNKRVHKNDVPTAFS